MATQSLDGAAVVAVGGGSRVGGGGRAKNPEIAEPQRQETNVEMPRRLIELPFRYRLLLQPTAANIMPKALLLAFRGRWSPFRNSSKHRSTV